ncbi:hypothetical protein ABZP36_035182 [Zizania latifolia]
MAPVSEGGAGGEGAGSHFARLGVAHLRRGARATGSTAHASSSSSSTEVTPSLPFVFSSLVIQGWAELFSFPFLDEFLIRDH